MSPRTNRTRSFGQRIRGMTDAFAGLRACAAAAEAGRRPPRAALQAIGIEPDAYYGIKID